ncbi:MAG: response regulator [Defluviitaleaceae bacterium]|nr:response regulator [Defluviitaleaceae bacterium]
MNKTVFIVDDNSINLTVAEKALRTQYRVIALPSAEKMFKALEKFKPDLIMLDVEMPEMSGFDAMKILKVSSAYANIPVIFLTALSDAKSEAYGIKLGAVDFILKPFSEPVLQNRVKNHLRIDELIRERTKQLLERTEELERLKNGLVFTMADLVENRDKNTGGHIDRTASYVQLLIDAMLKEKIYEDEIKDWDIESVVSSARLHDVGKMIIPDAILNKPGKLTDEEFEIMKSHSSEGAKIIDKAISRTGNAGFLLNAKKIAEYHHEKWNGAGYPYGLDGENIPLHGRIMAIADVYDALVSERPYKKAFTHDEAVEIIKNDAARHFDPVLVDCFLKIKDKFAKG